MSIAPDTPGAPQPITGPDPTVHTTVAPPAPTPPPAPAPAPAVAPVPVAANDQQVVDFIKKNYPQYVYLLAIPDIVGVFKNALDPKTGNTTLTESDAELTAQLQATTWWKTHGQAVRNYMLLQQSDPDTLNEKVQSKDAEVHQLANQMGLSDNLVNIDQIARNALMYDWSNAELQEQLAAQIRYNPASPTSSHIGTVDSAIQQIKSYAGEYMVNIDDQTAFNFAREVAAGHHNVQDYQSYFANQAKGRFPTLSDAIDQGITPKTYFDPIKQDVAKLLERTPDSIDLINDPKFSKIVSYTDPKTNAPRPMTMSEEQMYVRGLDDWKTTQQAQQSAASLGLSILKTFGKVAS